MADKKLVAAQGKPKPASDWREDVARNQKNTAAAEKRIRDELPSYYSIVDPNSKVTTAKRIENTLRAVKLHGEPFRPVIDRAAKKRGVSADLLQALLAAEQQGNEKYGDYKAASRAGAKGPFQITDDTAKRFNINRDDPESAADGAAQVLAELQTRLGTRDPYVLGAMYNAGDKIVRQYGGDANMKLPLETAQYVAALDAALKEIAKTRKPGSVLESIGIDPNYSFFSNK